MSDLISRKALEKAIRDYADEVGCNRGEYELANGILKSLSMVEKAPTAYDVDKVAEQIEAERYIVGVNASINDDTTADYIEGFNDMVNRSLDIAKGAVKDE